MFEDVNADESLITRRGALINLKYFLIIKNETNKMKRIGAILGSKKD